MVLNYALLEAVSDTPKVDWQKVETEFKKKMNTCKLTKFKSEKDCDDFYSGFFMNMITVDPPLSFQDWAIIYNDMLSEVSFVNSLVFFIVLYQPKDYQRMFYGIRSCLMNELPQIRKRLNADKPDSVQGKNILNQYSRALASMRSIQRGFDTVCTMVKTQNNDQNVMIFCSIINTSLQELVSYVERQIRKMIESEADPESIEIHYRHPLAESTEELIDDLFSIFNETTYAEIAELNEGIINTAKEKANVAAVKMKKLEERIDQTIMQKWKKLREGQRNRKHAEMVGEALRITHEINRVLVAAPVALINPMVGIMIWAASFAFDRATDMKDRNILIDDLKDKLEIVEEKIQIADRKGDDKERIELIRIRQKLARELKRISHVKYQKRG